MLEALKAEADEAADDQVYLRLTLLMADLLDAHDFLKQPA